MLLIPPIFNGVSPRIIKPTKNRFNCSTLLYLSCLLPVPDGQRQKTTYWNHAQFLCWT